MLDSVNKSQFIVSSLNLLKIEARPPKQAPNQSARKYIIHLLGKYFNSISIILQTATNLRFPMVTEDGPKAYLLYRRYAFGCLFFFCCEDGEQEHRQIPVCFRMILSEDYFRCAIFVISYSVTRLANAILICEVIFL